MNSSEEERILADERSAEQQYNELLRDRAATPIEVSMTRNAQITNDRLPRNDRPVSGRLVGRVRLNDANAIVDGADEFYIGTALGEANGVAVYNWHARVAATFYRTRTPHDLNPAVVGLRTFDPGHDGQLKQFEDDIVATNAPSPLFPRNTLSIPKPERRGPLPIASIGKAPIGISPAEPSPAAARSSRDIGGHKLAEGRGPAGTADQVPTQNLRAERILIEKLASPKRGDLSPVLSTLQPEQYDAITRPADDSVIFQGHPGTGKTIIAVHRLAFLTSPDEREHKAHGLVMLIGPTREYADHVGSAVRALVGEDNEYVLVSSLPALLDELSGSKVSPRLDTRVEEQALVGDEIIPYLKATLTAVRRDDKIVGLDRSAVVRACYERLRSDPAFPGGSAIDSGWYRFLRGLPPFEEATKEPALRPILAYFGMRYRKPRWFSDVAHVIVDEGQDVYPLEWEILGHLGASEGWTILGDLNQRRTEFTYRSWKPVATMLGIEVDGHAPIDVLALGYRSTAAIMRVANRLLPARERTLLSLQHDGVEPKKVRAPQRDKLAAISVAEATELVGHFPSGSVAIITVTTSQIGSELRRAGWSTDRSTSQVWSKGEDNVRLLSNDQARGLEFDGVVVVEPADFPQNAEGRLGALFTSLTRANKELVIVSHKALPEALRG